jgi:hypothetical protein
VTLNRINHNPLRYLADFNWPKAMFTVAWGNDDDGRWPTTLPLKQKRLASDA